jgi:hypothetical protein
MTVGQQERELLKDAINDLESKSKNKNFREHKRVINVFNKN